LIQNFLCGARNQLKILSFILFLFLPLTQAASAFAQTALPEVSANNGARLVGTQTCGSSTCHNSEVIWPNSAVKQNEFTKWKTDDPHRSATKTLLSPKAQDIARKLGIPSAVASDTCLDCHAFNVPGAQYTMPLSEDSTSYFELTPHKKLENGIACEACHGPAEKWLGVHAAGLYFYEANVEAGMYPTADPLARTQLCMSCHIGSEDKLVTHSMLAAGHPRMKFEVNFYMWFSAHEMTGRKYYSHFEVDSDYRQRKPLPYGMKVWSIGQAQQAQRTLDLVLSPKVNAGQFPELSLYNCDSCHREISELEAGNSPGYPRLNMSNLLFVGIISEVVAPELAGPLQQQIANMQKSVETSQEALIKQSQSLKTHIDKLVPIINAHRFTNADNLKAIDLITSNKTPAFTQFQTAEQALLAVASLLDELYRSEGITKQKFDAAQTILNGAFKQIDSGQSYQPQTVRAAFSQIRQIVF